MILAVVSEGITVGQFTLDAQNAVVPQLKGKGYAAGTIKRSFGAPRQPLIGHGKTERSTDPYLFSAYKKVLGGSAC